MDIQELEKFIDHAAIISKADSLGKITYVNEKFTEVSGYSLEDVIGKDHSIVNSGHHSKEFWSDMYKVVLDGSVWNKVVTNKKKNGDLYYVDTFIKAQFDKDTKELIGFMSIRQDVTELKRKEVEISNRMNAINQSNAVIEFELNGNIKYANDLFLTTMGYSTSSEIVGKHHSIFMEDDVKDSQAYIDFWERLNEGKFFSGEITRKKKDGSLIYLQATYILLLVLMVESIV
jgi:PAS domain S-box-containing protein